LQPTAEELAFGFAVGEAPAGERALILPLSKGLRAVKMIADDGGVEYVVCDDQFEPLYASAKTLDDLRRRFLRT